MSGIDPNIWGPSAWRLLHDISFYVAMANTEETLRQGKEFFMLLRHVLPCSKCQMSYDRHLLALPYPKQSKDVPRWVFELHHRVSDDVKGRHVEAPIWQEWHISYPATISHHTLRGAWPFIQSIAETYPIGSMYNKKVYIHSMERFFVLLWGFLRGMDGFRYQQDVARIEDLITLPRTKRVLPSARLFKTWVTMIGRRVYAHDADAAKCNKGCMAPQ